MVGTLGNWSSLPDSVSHALPFLQELVPFPKHLPKPHR